MKKLITICLLVAATFSVKAQEMSFDETVKYINDKIECCCIQHFPFSATRNGQITVKYAGFGTETTFNLFDLKDAKVDKRNLMQDNGIILFNNDGINYLLKFKISELETNSIYCLNSQAEAERLYKALLYLRSLCTKVKDPFDN